MNTTPAKVCIRCKRDCAERPRTRDQDGRYTCQECVDAVAAKASRPAAPPPRPAEQDEPDLSYALAEEQSVAAPVAQDSATCMGCGVLMSPGAVLCTHCGFDTRSGQRATTAKGKEKRGPKRCEKCGYDLTGLKKPKCPECGTVFRMGRDLKKERDADAKETLKWAYLKPLFTTLAGLGLLCAIAGGRGGEEWIVLYLIKYALGYPVATLVFMFCALTWVGLDAPIHLVILRMAGVCAVTDAAAAAMDGLPMFMATRFVVLTAFVGVLSDSMEMEISDAAIVGCLTWLAKVLIVLVVVMKFMPT